MSCYWCEGCQAIRDKDFVGYNEIDDNAYCDPCFDMMEVIGTPERSNALSPEDAAWIVKPLERMINNMPIAETEIDIHVAGENFTITADVNYQFHKAWPSEKEYPGGPPITPPEPAEIEIESIIFHHRHAGEDVETDLDFLLSEDQYSAIAAEILEDYMNPDESHG